MDVPAVLFLETIKPLAWVGGGLFRIALTPYMMFFWKEGYRVIDTFEQRRNIEKLIKMIEEENKPKREAGKKKSAVSDDRKKGESHKKGWRKLLPF